MHKDALLDGEEKGKKGSDVGGIAQNALTSIKVSVQWAVILAIANACRVLHASLVTVTAPILSEEVLLQQFYRQ